MVAFSEYRFFAYILPLIPKACNPHQTISQRKLTSQTHSQNNQNKWNPKTLELQNSRTFWAKAAFLCTSRASFLRFLSK